MTTMAAVKCYLLAEKCLHVGRSTGRSREQPVYVAAKLPLLGVHHCTVMHQVSAVIAAAAAVIPLAHIDFPFVGRLGCSTAVMSLAHIDFSFVGRIGCSAR